jgi:hypothetical protein
MKKIIAILLLLATLVSLAACTAKTYPAIDSTEEESRVVMTMTVDGKTYDVKYELYRTFFLTYKSQIDGGDGSVWSGENREKYIAEINEIIVDRIAEIYSAFAICERIGFDLYSKKVEKKLDENIRVSVEGGSYGSSTLDGYETYDDYLAALKSMNMNYSVQILLMRYAIAIDAIDTYYIGTASSDDVDATLSVGAIEYTEQDVRDFYFSDDCARVLRANFQKAISYTPLERAESLRSDMVEAAESADTFEEKENAVLLAIRKSGLYSNTAELQSGYVIGRYNLERSYYGDMTDAALELELGEVSDPIEVVSDVENSYYVIYKTLKSEEHLEANYESIRYIFLMNCVGEISHSVASDLKASVVYTEVLNGIDYSRIAM